MQDFLRLSDLSQYAVVFEEMGYDNSVGHLVGMAHKDLMDLRQITKMKPGHFARLLSSIQEARGPATPSESIYPSESMSQIPVSDASSDVAQLGPIQVGPTVLMTVRDGVAQIGPNEIGPNEVDAPLLKVYDDWKKALVASYNHSTNLGCSAMLDVKKSGGRYKTVRCRTALSKKKKESDEDDGPTCAYALRWSKDKKGDWKLNQNKSILKHIPFCSSGQRVLKSSYCTMKTLSAICVLASYLQAKLQHSWPLVPTADWQAVSKILRPVVHATLLSISTM